MWGCVNVTVGDRRSSGWSAGRVCCVDVTDEASLGPEARRKQGGVTYNKELSRRSCANHAVKLCLPAARSQTGTIAPEEHLKTFIDVQLVPTSRAAGLSCVLMHFTLLRRRRRSSWIVTRAATPASCGVVSPPAGAPGVDIEQFTPSARGRTHRPAREFRPAIRVGGHFLASFAVERACNGTKIMSPGTMREITQIYAASRKDIVRAASGAPRKLTRLRCNSLLGDVPRGSFVLTGIKQPH